MKKKILTIAVAIVMLLAVAGLVACDSTTVTPTLAQYQATARVDLTNYANSRGQTNFTTENWAVIQGYVTTGKAAIDAAETKPAVRTARDNAKAAIRAVERENNVNNYTRHPNSVDTIDARLENQIRQDWVARFFEYSEAERAEFFDDTFILAYFGTYNGAVVIDISCPITVPNVDEYVIVAGVKIYFHGNQVLVWYKEMFLTIEEAYNDKLLSTDNIEKIANIVHPWA